MIDPHKLLFAPYDCAALLYRDPALASRAHTQEASYLDDINAEFGDIDSVNALLDEDTAAIILEPIQSMGGVRMAVPEFYQALRARCDEANAMLIYDEVQTGMGRTGEFYFAGRYGVVPDMVALAKGIASGVPMGAVLMPGLGGLSDFGDLAHASSLCGACRDACPVMIDIPRMLVAWRQRVPHSRIEGLIFRLTRIGMTSPLLYRLGVSFGRIGLNFYARDGRIRGGPPVVTRWTHGRDFPPIAARTFHERWKE